MLAPCDLSSGGCLCAGQGQEKVRSLQVALPGETDRRTEEVSVWHGVLWHCGHTLGKAYSFFFFSVK